MLKPFAPFVRVAAVAGRLALVVLACCAPVDARADEKRSPEELLVALAERHAGLESLTASFRQEYRSATIGQSVAEHGRVWVKRPLLRWDTEAPDSKVFLVDADGTTLFYVPADRTATRGALPDDAPHLELLLGRADVVDDFAAAEVTLKEPVSPTTRQLRLVPRKPMPGVRVVYVEIDESALAVRRVLVIDELENESDIVFDDVRANVRVRDRVFDPRLPRGVTVRGAGGAEDEAP